MVTAYIIINSFGACNQGCILPFSSENRFVRTSK